MFTYKESPSGLWSVGSYCQTTGKWLEVTAYLHPEDAQNCVASLNSGGGVPRALCVQRWTKERPSKPGWYWVRQSGDGEQDACGIVRIKRDPGGGLMFEGPVYDYPDEDWEQFEFSGPIPGPIK